MKNAIGYLTIGLVVLLLIAGFVCGILSVWAGTQELMDRLANTAAICAVSGFILGLPGIAIVVWAFGD